MAAFIMISFLKYKMQKHMSNILPPSEVPMRELPEHYKNIFHLPLTWNPPVSDVPIGVVMVTRDLFGKCRQPSVLCIGPGSGKRVTAIK
jgi:hypothetical protein